ncbi:MAG: hypothetical protein ACI4AQ_06990 [Lachnospiraceae bacterium]
MEEYINKRMLEIPQLEERMLYKEIVGNLIKELYRYNETSYQELKERILSEAIPERTDYTVYMTMTDMQHYDATDSFMHPMREEDTGETKISYEDIKNALDTKEPLRLYTVFFETKASAVWKLLKEERIFHGAIKTGNREYRADFIIKPNQEYLKQIEELYYIFMANYRSWTTVCTAYLTKLFDVYLYTAEDMKDKENIIEISVDFEEYSQVVRHDVFPLWNLKPFREKTSTYPEPGIDRVNYEHRIFSHRLNPECEYLVTNTDVEITNIRRMNGDLIITCPADNPHNWDFYQVHKEKRKGNYPYPVLSNRYKECFSGNVTEMYKMSIKTKAEMARLIEAFPYTEYVEFKGFEIMENVPDGWEDVNYNMDGFMVDEIRIGNRQKVLAVFFMARQTENYLNEDIMSFLVTQIQKIFPEYRCVGKMV